MLANHSWKLKILMSELAKEKTAKAVDKRQSIIDAAINVFADKGYHASRISDIAQRAGIAYGLVYHYFKNKEEILDTIFLDGWGGFIDAVEASAYDVKIARTVVDLFLNGMGRKD